MGDTGLGGHDRPAAAITALRCGRPTAQSLIVRLGLLTAPCTAAGPMSACDSNADVKSIPAAALRQPTNWSCSSFVYSDETVSRDYRPQLCASNIQYRAKAY